MIEANVPKPQDSEAQLGKQEEQGLPTAAKVAIGILIVIVLAAVGLFIGLRFKYGMALKDKAQVETGEHMKTFAGYVQHTFAELLPKAAEKVDEKAGK